MINLIVTVLGSALNVLLFVVLMRAIKRKGTEAKRLVAYYDDGTPPKFYITGDKHRNFEKVKSFCTDMNTRKKDVLIVLGDAGFNYYGDERDDALKREIAELDITLLCIHGNKENRPQNVGTYGIKSFCGGKVYYEPRYPSICFAIDGEAYTFEGRKYIAVGGAHSVDKLRCLEEGLAFWEDEMPSDEVKAHVWESIRREGNEVFGMLTHTCPIDCIPTEMFMSVRQNAAIKRAPKRAKKAKKPFTPDIDRSTEIWLGEIEKGLKYEVWYCGHYHIDKQIDKIHMMHTDIQPLHMGMW